MVGSAQGALIASTGRLREDLLTIVRAAVEAAGAGAALTRALADSDLHTLLTASGVSVVAAGKAAAPMATRFLRTTGVKPVVTMAVGTHGGGSVPDEVEWHEAGHPLPDARSVEAAGRALTIARAVGPDDTLLLLLSGGASALLASPAEGLTLDDKQRVVDAMLRGGADIHALNTVRKHLSQVKGGRLAAASRGHTVTLAISDVVGDDLAVIGSGPAVPDPSTWDDAARALDRYVPPRDQPAAVRSVIARGLAGTLADTPKPRDASMARVRARVIASRLDAMRGARDAAERLGYRAVVLDEAVTGDATEAAIGWFDRLRASGPGTCVITSGETTVRVTGRGRGGRNQEFALALVGRFGSAGPEAAAASIGTDGVDGPTDAAGAIVDAGTAQRAAALGLDPGAYLADNDSHPFFAAVGGLIHTGPTGTNVGDVQILLKLQSR